MDATYALIFADTVRKFCLLDVTIKNIAFRFIEVYAHSDLAERLGLFRGSSRI